ncbi:ABC transporter ATP-binding protein [Oceanibacterium hippocampi]|uniref:Lipopolysaccharide export system ATP-binding protein LptB n=1 Tax=Oceanibacterium hippocampi TaxID=745714 RepID=A0A1Y5RRP4_9PROT|nr:ABC transporter ATP-binding protein [Oceanibacterium hippocampi]SLN23805.1 Lipopolysaccharide export system ATP-binding protein LptB [Oceanibacterium hippocampi]
MTAEATVGAALSCRDIEVSYGAFKAVAGVTYDFRPGRLYSLIGPNGAGKTTLMNALSGGVPLSRGQVTLGGKDITGLAPHARTRAGLGRSFQITQIFPGMTVFENLRLAAQAHRYRLQPFWNAVGGFREIAREAERVLAEVGLEQFASVNAGNLSHGDQRALDVGLTMLGDPGVVLLDEPLAGVGHGDAAKAVALIRRLAEGRTVLLIEHNMDVVMDISDEIIVMLAGKILAAGPPEEIRHDQRVRNAYLGEDE